MGNIIGEGFNEKILKQVEARQKVFGAIDRRNYLKYLNGRGTFIKLSSSVNVTSATKLEGTGLANIGLRDNKLAQEYVLFGGTATNSGTALRSGLYDAYNVGDQSQGYRPMPGITSIESKNRNRGSIRETTINIKAYNTTQFNIIDLLYLRLGYTVLLEWGHTIYVDNDLKEEQINESNTLTSKFVNGDYKNQGELLKAISDNKIKLYGNYDAIYGKVSNFSWNFETDGSYTINMTVLSLGDVIESLKINTIAEGKTQSTSEKKEETEDIEEAETDEEIITAYKNKDKICQLFYKATKAVQGFDWFGLGNSSQTFSGGEGNTITGLSDETAKSLGFISGGDYISFEEDDTDEDMIFVRLGGFLEYLKNNALIYSGDTAYFDVDNDENTNLLFTSPYVLSADPRVCIVKTEITVKNIGWFDSLFSSADSYKIFDNLPFSFKETVANTLVGKLMNVYMNVSWILKSMDGLRDEDGKVSLYELLNKICEGINNSLGNLNKLSVAVDEEDNNRLYFLDETTLPNRNEIIKIKNPNASIDLAIFEIYGYKPNNATFVKNLNIKTEISNEMATMITIGAQANGSAVGEDATAFSKWNEGLIDRIIPEKKDTKKTAEVLAREAAEKLEESIKEQENYEETIEEYEDFVEQMSNYEFTDNIDYFGSILTNFLDINQAKESNKENKQSTTGGFIPINLGLEIVGLSGMKIYQKFSINQTFLPYNYPNTLEFLIKGLSQKVDMNGWVTNIESLSIPKDASSPAYPAIQTFPKTFTSTGAVGSGAAKAVSTGGTKAKYSVSNIPDSIDKCAAVKGDLKESIVTSKIQNAYSTVRSPSYVKGKQSFIAKLEKAYDALVKQGITLNIGDSLRSYNTQKEAYKTNEAARQSNPKLAYKAHPCQGYHVRGQALDLNQIATQKADIQSHGKIYKALYDAGLRRISNEWWHWGVGETDHEINKKFPGDIANYNRY